MPELKLIRPEAELNPAPPALADLVFLAEKSTGEPVHPVSNTPVASPPILMKSLFFILKIPAML